MTQHVQALFGVDPAVPRDVFSGWWDPQQWRTGWACPYFSRAVAGEILAWYDWHDEGDTRAEGRGSYAWHDDVLVVTDADGDVDRYQPVTLPGVPEPVYDLGSGRWAWEVVPVPDGADLAEWLAEQARPADRSEELVVSVAEAMDTWDSAAARNAGREDVTSW